MITRVILRNKSIGSIKVSRGLYLFSNYNYAFKAGKVLINII